jgi:hypothetical protein
MLKTAVDLWPGNEVLLCPVCGCEYVHPLKVKVATYNRIFTIDPEGCIIQGHTAETDKAAQARGVRIILEYRCENGHHGNLILQFHKGSTFVHHEILPTDDGLETLWRS